MKRGALSVAGLLILVLIGLASTLRFVNVTQSPPGFYVDEAAISAQVICLRQSGENLQQERFPLLTPVLAGGYLTPTYLYPAIIWTSVFGDSIASFRSFAAFFSVLFILGMFVFGLRFWCSVEAGILCALSAAISPWAFHFARIAWDPSLAPAYMVWAFALLWSRRKWEIVLSGVLFSAAAYCYPPLRLHLAIMMPFAIAWLGRRRKFWRPYVLTVLVAGFLSLPLIELTLSGEIQARFEVLSVFDRDFLIQTYGEPRFINGLRELIHNFGLLLSPKYLFVNGDSNLRHSTGQLGIWSWLDCLSVFASLVALALIVTKNSLLKPSRFRVAFVIVGYLAGILPAALTWESNPHALRSFGAITFLALGVGGALTMMWRHSQAMRAAVIGTAFVSFLHFVNIYFVEYPHDARFWFDEDVTEFASNLIQDGRIMEIEAELKNRGFNYEPMAIYYYQLASGAARCPVRPESATR